MIALRALCAIGDWGVIDTDVAVNGFRERIGWIDHSHPFPVVNNVNGIDEKHLFHSFPQIR